LATRVLFLDFDGVLHPTTNFTSDGPLIKTVLFGWLPNLRAVLTPHPDVSLVVHSTWRLTHDVNELRGVLGVLGRHVVGATPLGERYASIRAWLDMNPQVTSYRILDDDAAEFPKPAPAELVLCDPRAGVAAPEVLEELRRWLEE
jgi:hypothetical protein